MLEQYSKSVYERSGRHELSAYTRKLIGAAGIGCIGGMVVAVRQVNRARRAIFRIDPV